MASRTARPCWPSTAWPGGRCTGFGSRQFKGVYFEGNPRFEPFHRYEYPGIHRMLLWAVRGAMFCRRKDRFVITSGYRRRNDNEDHARRITNHQGKAIDIAFKPAPGRARNVPADCSLARVCIVETADAQIGWSAAIRTALEPSEIAPTWSTPTRAVTRQNNWATRRSARMRGSSTATDRSTFARPRRPDGADRGRWGARIKEVTLRTWGSTRLGSFRWATAQIPGLAFRQDGRPSFSANRRWRRRRPTPAGP